MTMSDYQDDLELDDAPEIREKPDLETTLRTLETNVDGALSATVFYGLSGLTADELPRVGEVWVGLPDDYRAKLLQQLVEVSETNFDLDYRTLGLYALDDERSDVRVAAIELLWEDESLELMDRLIRMAQWDESNDVRAQAAGALGRFILLGELGDLPESETVRAQDAVINLLTDPSEDEDVRRRSLEAIANCSHEIVPEAIEEAYQSGDSLMQASALFAMGKTCDERWSDAVMLAFESDDPALRYEAARASGELELDEAIPILARFAMGSDREIKEVSIWSLGEIGGGAVIKILSSLAEMAEEADDVELLDAIEEAMSNASLAGGDLDFDFDD